MLFQSEVLKQFATTFIFVSAALQTVGGRASSHKSIKWLYAMTKLPGFVNGFTDFKTVSDKADFKTVSVSVNALAILSLMGWVDTTLQISLSMILILLASLDKALKSSSVLLLETSLHTSTHLRKPYLRLISLSTAVILLETSIHLSTETSIHLSMLFVNTPNQTPLSITVILLKTSKTSMIVILLEIS
jgi:hypothetical protein